MKKGTLIKKNDIYFSFFVVLKKPTFSGYRGNQSQQPLVTWSFEQV